MNTILYIFFILEFKKNTFTISQFLDYHAAFTCSTSEAHELFGVNHEKDSEELKDSSTLGISLR